MVVTVFENATDWTLRQSASHTLHISSAALLQAILDFHMSPSNETPQRSEQLLRRILTALVHHCSQPEQFTPIASLLLQKLSCVAEEDPAQDLYYDETVRRILEVISVPCSARKGSRFNSEYISYRLVEIYHINANQINNCAIFLFSRRSSSPRILVGNHD